MFKLKFISALASISSAFYLYMAVAAAPLVMRMFVSLRGVAYVRIYPYPSITRITSEITSLIIILK